MIIQKTVKFGYGTILVGANRDSRELTLEYVEPPVAVGTKVRKEDLVGSVSHGKISFKYGKDMRTLQEDLKQVSAENPLVQFREYTFDFTNFNPSSVKSVQDMLIKAIMGNTLPLAC